MKSRIVGLILLVAFPCPVLAGESVIIPLSSLTIDGVADFVTANRINSIEALLPCLPAELRNNYVLMAESHSRQAPSSIPYPRIIMFLPDGKFYMGIATDTRATGYFDAEMLEFRADKTWKLRAIRLDPSSASFIHTAGPQVNEPHRCTDCHGSASRPIWGSYPCWPGAYADGAGHTLTRPQQDALNAALDRNGTHPNPRLEALHWKYTDWTSNRTLVLPDRHRGLTNEALNDAIGARQIDHLWKRLRHANHFEVLLLAHMFLRDRFCEGVPGVDTTKQHLLAVVDAEWSASGLNYPLATPRDKTLLLLGMGVYDDLFLSKGLHELAGIPENQQIHLSEKWNYIAIYLGDFITFRFLDHIVTEYPEYDLGRLMVQTPPDPQSNLPYANLHEYRRDVVRYQWEIDRDEQLTLLRSKTPPTVDLRHEFLFTIGLQTAIGPKLIEFAERKKAEYDSGVAIRATRALQKR